MLSLQSSMVLSVTLTLLRMVQAGPERCEYPEVVSCGTLPTLKDAQAMAEEEMLEADRTYQTIVYS